MRAIWKFRLSPVGVVAMPKDAEIFSVGEQDGGIVAWALCDPHAPTVRRTVAIHPTGDGSHVWGVFVGTVQMESGLVFHVFDLGERPDA